MIIPCIDLQNGQAVQLVRGRKRALAVDDILGLLHRFRSYPILHVIDLDAAMRKGSNACWIKRLCQAAKLKVRVGGGIRTPARAERILSWGAEKVIIGSAAFDNGQVARKFLAEMAARVGRKRVIIALDTQGGHIVVRGWKERLRLRPADVIPALEPYCSEFFSTYVDNEGTMEGTDIAGFRRLRGATRFPITAAGGIRSMREVNALEKIGMNAAVGMAIYTGRLASEITGIQRNAKKPCQIPK
ncbi:MAG TPA: HisA/HisF-related TIM barrel protein [Candidatus Acidoferrales bacterium]|jgi:phosphoribosylformimino-5-aminoimidazole carboxamide ribotide isomerase|nr:HisA/HisF-related TIM barrel protein [Candidatus Acidoferrales bacterium]